MNTNEPCVCCSGRPFGKCCEPLLGGRQYARTPKQLMRSRYAAYALGGFPEYLKNTWHPADASAIRVADLEGGDVEWTGLEILSSEQKGNAGYVEFRAGFRDNEGMASVHHERSVFVRHRNRWYYLSGDVNTESA